MKILYIVSRPLQINSSASLRNICTINGIATDGHDVDVLTAEYDINHPNYTTANMHEKVKITYLNVSGVKKLASLGRGLKFLNKFRRMLYRKFSKNEIYDNLKCIVTNVPKIDLKCKKYDMVISSSDPKSSHLFTLDLINQNRIGNIPWIQIWGDPFYLDLTRKNKKKNSLIKAEEERLIEKADKVVYVSALTLQEQRILYPQYSKKMCFIPRPYEKEMLYNNKKNSENEQISFAYCGDFNSNVRNIKPLYNAVKSTGDKMIICGSSDVKLDSTDYILVKERVSYEKVLDFEATCNVLVHISNLKGSQIPGKIYHYSATNKPILFILDGNSESIKDEFKKYNRYEFCENNEKSIIEAIEKIKNHTSNANNIPVADFSIESVVKKILN